MISGVMKRVEITIDGQAYPCRMTMGAMLLFKQQTGREATSITTDAISDLVTIIWCCIKSASRHERIDFDLTLEDFADGITPDEAETMFSVLSDGDTPEESAEKKTSSKR